MCVILAETNVILHQNYYLYSFSLPFYERRKTFFIYIYLFMMLQIKEKQKTKKIEEKIVQVCSTLIFIRYIIIYQKNNVLRHTTNMYL